MVGPSCGNTDSLVLAQPTTNRLVKTRASGNSRLLKKMGFMIKFPAIGMKIDGEFVIDVRQEQPDWQKPGQPVVPYGDPENPLGDRWLGFRDTPEYQGFGIHGTHDPDSIGKQESQGCIRLRNEDVIFLYRIVPMGTKVYIRE